MIVHWMLLGGLAVLGIILLILRLKHTRRERIRQVQWMILFLLVGYIGLRALLDDDSEEAE